jgi:hypothetical protein
MASTCATCDEFEIRADSDANIMRPILVKFLRGRNVFVITGRKYRET